MSIIRVLSGVKTGENQKKQNTVLCGLTIRVSLEKFTFVFHKNDPPVFCFNFLSITAPMKI